MARLQHIDIAKGAGIILVVWGHSLIEFGHYIIYMFHMPLFFYLSGIFHKSCRLGEFCEKRVKSLLFPLLIFMVVLSLLIPFIGESYVRISPPHFGGVFGPLWFLVALFIVSIMYHVMIQFKPYNRLFLCFIISFALGYLPSLYGVDNYIYGLSAFSALVFYAIGNIIGDKYLAGRSRRLIGAVFILSVISIYAMYLISFKVFHYELTDMFDNNLPSNFILFIVSAILGISMVLSFSIMISGNNRVAMAVAFIGECSIYIFAFHMALMVTSRKYLPFNGLLFELCLILCSLILGCVLRQGFKKILPAIFK